MPNVQSPLYIQAGQSISLTCTATGSLPITYMWYKKQPDGTKTRLSRQAALTVSDAGTYYCEAENFASGKKVEQSDPIELIVQGRQIHMSKTVVDMYKQRRSGSRNSSNKKLNTVHCFITPTLHGLT